MRIKKYKNNQYIKTNNYNYWIRNYTNSSYYIDINNITSQKDYFQILENEFWNNKARYSWIDSENIYYKNIIIISDGYDLDKITSVISQLTKQDDFCLIGINNVLNKWKCEKSINYYVVNNPYKECMRFLPNSNGSLPKCVASNRTYYYFLQNYNGMKFRYNPVNEEVFGFTGTSENFYQIDDYRNAVCASIGLAYRFKANKIILLCCDDVFNENKPGSIPTVDSLFQYEQQNVAVEIIDSYLYWLKNKLSVKYYCRWKKISNAQYIDIGDILEYIRNEN